MSVIALTSVTGSPGVTTTAVALAVSWPRPVILVEADPVGASSVLPGFLRGQYRHQHGILDAAVSARAGTLAEDVAGFLIDLPGTGHARLLAGCSRPEQADTMTRSWPVLAPALAQVSAATGIDVLLDAGRLSQAGAPLPALGTADRVLLLTGSTLPALHIARAWLPTIRGTLVDDTRLGLLVVGEGQPYRATEIAHHLGTPVVGVLAQDPPAARAWSTGARHPRRSDLARSITTLTTTLTTAPGRRTPTPAGGTR